MKTGNETPAVGEKEITMAEVLKKAAEDTIRKMELGGRPETRDKSWPAMKVGMLVGFQMGGDLGYKLGMHIAATPMKDENQMELFEDAKGSETPTA